MKLLPQHQQLLDEALEEAYQAKRNNKLRQRVYPYKLDELRRRMDETNGLKDRLTQDLSGNHWRSVYKEVHSNLTWPRDRTGKYQWQCDIDQAVEIAEIAQQGTQQYKHRYGIRETRPYSGERFDLPGDLFRILTPQEHLIVNTVREVFAERATPEFPDDFLLADALQEIANQHPCQDLDSTIQTMAELFEELGWIE